MIVIVRIGLPEKVRVNVKFGVQIKAAQIQHFCQRHLAKMHGLHRRTRIHVLEALDQRLQHRWLYQIRLGNKNLVGETHLPARFLALVKLLLCMHRVHQGDDGVEQVGFRNLFIHKKGLRYRARVRQAGGFNHDAVKTQQALASLGAQQLQGFTQIFANCATDATVAHLHDLLF